jgi:hypothetical protein
MDTLFEIKNHDVLLGQARVPRRRRRVVEHSAAATRGVRFAFYGRTSTAEYQDPMTSRAWQREIASALVAGQGTITVEFFDVGWSASGVGAASAGGCIAGTGVRIGSVVRCAGGG